MSDKFYITNKTNEQMLFTVSDTFTGSNVLSGNLMPGTNEVNIAGLISGVYLFHLEYANHEVLYEQQIIKE